MIENSEEENTISKGLRAVLEAIPSKQLNDFEQYLAFEPFESNQRLSKFYLLLQKHFFKKRKPKTNLIDDLESIGISGSQFNKFQTFLHQKLDQFLAIQQIIQHPHRYHSHTLEAYNDLKIDYATTEKKWRQLLKKIQKEEQTFEHFQQLSNLEHYATKMRINAGAKISNSYFEKLHNLIDQDFLLRKLQCLCASVNEATILNHPFPQDAIDSLKTWLKLHTIDLPPFGKAYLELLLLMENSVQSIEVYQKFFDNLLTYQAQIASFDCLELFNYLLNLSFRRAAIGEEGFVAFIVKIYQYLIKSKLLLLEGEIPSRTFKNIVSMNCRIANYDWCLQFIEDYQKYLAPDEKKLLPEFCIGLVHFYAGNHHQSAATFRKVIQIDPEDQFLGFESRNLLLKSYFHRFEDLSIDENEDLYRLIDSFRMYIRRNTKLSQIHQKSYLNFIYYFNVLLRHKELHGNRSGYPLELQTEIEKLEFITNKTWLLNEILEKSKG